MKGPAFMLVFLAVTSFISYSQTEKKKQTENNKQAQSAPLAGQPQQRPDSTYITHHRADL